MELRQLQIFATAAQLLNFTKAAATLGYAQSNVTSQIRQLEEELGVKLFDRIGRGLQLTNEGKSFLRNATAILELCAKAKEEFSPDTFRGIITIGAAETLCIYRLPKLLTEYRRRYPQVEVRIETENCHQLLPMLRNNSVDVALVLTNQVNQPDLVVKTLHEEVMAAVVSPYHDLAKQRTITPEDLSGQSLIITAEGCGYRPLILTTLHEHQVTPGSVMELSSVGAIKECVACGLGLAILPKASVHDELQRGKLQELIWEGPPFEVKTQLCYHRDKWISPTLKAFLDLCNTDSQW